MHIIQKRWLKPTQDVKLEEDHFVTVTYKSLLSEKTFKLDLYKISPESSRQKAFGRKPVGFSIIFLVLALINLVIGVLEKDPQLRPSNFKTVLVWVVCLAVTASYAWVTRIDIVAYFNKFSGQPILTLHRNNPEPASFESFINELDRRLNAIHRPVVPPEEPSQSSSPFSNN